MKAFNNYDSAKKAAENSGSTQLPVGAYVAKIMNVRYESGENGNSDRIQIQFDITEGEHKDFFKNQYENNDSEDKKWKGKTTIYVPSDSGSEQDGWTKNTFAKWTTSFEKSNAGYSWDWNEEGWKGKIIGLVFRRTGTVINGKEVTYTEVAFPIDAETVRSGKAPEAKFKAKNGYTGTQQNDTANDYDFVSVPEGTEEEIPF